MKHFYAAEEYSYGMGEHYAVQPVFGTAGGILTGHEIIIRRFPNNKMRMEWIMVNKPHRYKLMADDKVRRQAFRNEKSHYVICKVSEAPHQ